jgi:hypothetical protein
MATDGSNLQRVAQAAVLEGSTRAGNTINRNFSPIFDSAIAWSPNGKRVAYVKRFEAASPGPSEDKQSLETVDLLGGQPKVLKTSTHLMNVVTWVTDGRLLFGYRPLFGRIQSPNSRTTGKCDGSTLGGRPLSGSFANAFHRNLSVFAESLEALCTRNTRTAVLIRSGGWEIAASL